MKAHNTDATSMSETILKPKKLLDTDVGIGADFSS